MTNCLTSYDYSYDVMFDLCVRDRRRLKGVKWNVSFHTKISLEFLVLYIYGDVARMPGAKFLVDK